MPRDVSTHTRRTASGKTTTVRHHTRDGSAARPQKLKRKRGPNGHARKLGKRMRAAAAADARGRRQCSAPSRSASAGVADPQRNVIRPRPHRGRPRSAQHRARQVGGHSRDRPNFPGPGRPGPDDDERPDADRCSPSLTTTRASSGRCCPTGLAAWKSSARPLRHHSGTPAGTPPPSTACACPAVRLAPPAVRVIGMPPPDAPADPLVALDRGLAARSPWPSPRAAPGTRRDARPHRGQEDPRPSAGSIIWPVPVPAFAAILPAWRVLPWYGWAAVAVCARCWSWPCTGARRAAPSAGRRSCRRSTSRRRRRSSPARWAALGIARHQRRRSRTAAGSDVRHRRAPRRRRAGAATWTCRTASPPRRSSQAPRGAGLRAAPPAVGDLARGRPRTSTRAAGAVDRRSTTSPRSSRRRGRWSSPGRRTCSAVSRSAPTRAAGASTPRCSRSTG